ncbi:hypothetical protein SUSAZ_03845 [Sulfolobus acidocaldarius SUSAZ]|nr:hypothetical protein SUSAZ_03845 [Sulfolobus acidocaldarius SUSAZ]
MSTNVYITALARVYKANTLTKSTVLELLDTKNWKDAVTILKDKGLIPEIPSKLEDAENLLRDKAVKTVATLKQYTLNSKVAAQILDLYEFILTMEDIEAVISASILGKKDGVNVRYLKELVDVRPQSLEDVVSTVKGTYKEALRFSLDKAGNKTPSRINSYLEYYFIDRLYQIISNITGDARMKAQEIICGYVDYVAVSLAFTLKEQERSICKISSDIIRDIINMARPDELSNILSRTSYAKLLTLGNPYDLLASFKRAARVLARNASINAFMNSPSVVSILAIAELTKLDYEDLVTILNGIALKINDKIKNQLSFDIV